MRHSRQENDALRQEPAEVKAERDLAQAKLAPYPVSFTLRRD